MEKTFARGSVRRIKLRNFLTYTFCEFEPDPRLNLVIGPNGSGKSSIVCALCLGMCGGTNLLGRAKNIGDFVRTGCESADIEIELQHIEGPASQRAGNPVFSRHLIRANNKSSWKLNGKATSQKKVKELMLQYGVQVDNLCQFLPQDRVGEFSTYAPPKILRETEKAVYGEDAERHHDKLIEYQKRAMDGERTVRTLKKQETSLQESIDKSERQVQAMRRREALIAEANFLQKMVPWLQWLELKNEFKEKQPKLRKLRDTVAEIKKSNAPLAKAVGLAAGKAKSATAAASSAKDAARKDNRSAKKVIDQDARQHFFFFARTPVLPLKPR
jgi:chromosome segregation ATPase